MEDVSINKLKKWINDHKIVNSIILIGLIIGIAVVAGLIVNRTATHCSSELSADGVLSYIGSVLSAIGSIIVGIVAVWQTKKANELAERAQVLEEWHYKMEIRPFVLVSKLQYEELKLIDIMGKTHIPIYKINKSINGNLDTETSDKVYGILWITFSNTTNSLIIMHMKECEAIKTREKWQYSQTNNVLRNLSINGNGDGVVGLYADKNLWSYIDPNGLILDLILENRFAERYQESIELKFFRDMKANSDLERETKESNDIFYSAQNYKLGKFSKNDKIKWEKS